eukprot:CAMPEP_0173421546 /NCGR_PEP_ID=MMETSP1357-20121228/2624_1 /TAXON_ID=77926 /ORGANISM="Hemiselmis rufescens, Strain PCC563" /LENGTH=344 /DNA_ID=CAMNT_0014384473 /DNA_START=64 /DNA_END=1096 /DNA_ORIENTATION=-
MTQQEEQKLERMVGTPPRPLRRPLEIGKRLSTCQSLSRHILHWEEGPTHEVFDEIQEEGGQGCVQLLPKDFPTSVGDESWKKAYRDSKGVWIWKPSASARGMGIKLVTKLDQVSKTKSGVIQSYLASPLLIQGFKFDIRLYVVATSFNPLKLYLYDNGLVRLSTRKYHKVQKHSSDRSRYMHLTNYSVNKKSSHFEPRTDDDFLACTGSKWSLHALWKHLQDDRGYSKQEVLSLQSRIRDIVTKTYISAEDHINTQMAMSKLHRTNCFEIWGVDVLVDSNLTPWLIEVNTAPDMSASSPLDKAIKGSVFTDTYTLVGIPIANSASKSQQVLSKLRSNAAAAKGG